MKKYFLILCTILLISNFYSCKSNKKKEEHNSISKKELTILRYDDALFAIPHNNIQQGLKNLQEKFPFFMDGADLNDPKNIQHIKNFIEDPQAIDIKKRVDSKYSNLDNLNKELYDAFSICMKELGQPADFPLVYTYISYLDYENRTLFMDSVVVIALDMYLGADYGGYDKMQIPRYISARLDSQYIAVDVMRGVANYYLSPNLLLKNMLDHVVYQGKVLCFLETVLPKVPTNVILGYTPEQMKWVEKNEVELWSYIIQNQLLYEQDLVKYRPFISDGPTTSGFPGSPSHLGAWFGRQIIKKYMDKENVNIKTVFENTNSQKILKDSGFKPKK